ncbi:MAG: hypothetical protein QOD63_2459, partial [Actinomycetota bacterium]|nr:hypothetical protein [Actinomycetota bacterium]
MELMSTPGGGTSLAVTLPIAD